METEADAFVVEVDASTMEEAEASNFATEREAEEELELELEEVLESALALALLGSTVL